MAYIEDVPECDDPNKCSLEWEEQVGAVARRHKKPFDG